MTVPGLIFNVFNQVGANLVQTIDLVDHELKRLEKEYGPLGAKFQKIYDHRGHYPGIAGLVRVSQELAQHIHSGNFDSGIRHWNLHRDVPFRLFNQRAFLGRSRAFYRHDRG